MMFRDKFQCAQISSCGWHTLSSEERYIEMTKNAKTKERTKTYTYARYNVEELEKAVIEKIKNKRQEE